MKDTFNSFMDLQEKFREGVDYRIQAFDRGSSIIIIAPHGGGIDPGSSELARAIAGGELSLYLFEGIRTSGNDELHITSHRFDEPTCLDMGKRHGSALTIHGCGVSKAQILIGGRDCVLKQNLYDQLKSYFSIEMPSNGKYAGQEPTNICNRTRSGQGVQLEFTAGLRKCLFANHKTRKGRQTTMPQFEELVRVIREVIL